MRRRTVSQEHAIGMMRNRDGRRDGERNEPVRTEELRDEGPGAGSGREAVTSPPASAWTATAPDRIEPGSHETEDGRLNLDALVADSPDSGEDVAAQVAGRRRRRGPLAVVLVILLVLGAALAGGAVWAEYYARERISTAVQDGLSGLSQDARVSTEGILLPQLASGALRRVDVEASRLSLGPVLGVLSGKPSLGPEAELAFDDFDASMTQVGTSSPHRAGTITMSGTLDWETVSILLQASSQGLEGATASAGTVGASAQEPGTMAIATSHYGVNASVEAAPSVTPEGNLLLTVESASVGSQVSADVPAEWLGYVGLDSTETEVPMSLLPQGVRLSSAVVTAEGLRLTFEGRDVSLSQL